jgi:hypothetical protein
MNVSFSASLVKLGLTYRLLAVACLGAAGCAGVMSTESPLTPAQLAQTAESACSGVPAKLRDEGLLAYRNNIANTMPLTEGVAVGKVKFDHTRGELVAMRATPNMTVPWLGRVNSCHVALAQSGQVNAAAGSDPFVVPGTTVRIEETYTGYLLTIHANSDEVASDVVQRANAMLALPSAPATAELLNH